MISLPRQARDKHRVALKTDRFLAASTSPRMGEGASMTACCRMSQGQDLASSITALRSRRKGRGQPRRLGVWNRSLLKRLCLAWRARCEQYFMPLLATPFSGSKTIICQDKLGTNTQKTGNAPPTCFCADPWLPGHDKNKCRMVYQYATPTNLSDPYLANWTQPRSFVWPEQGVQVRKTPFCRHFETQNDHF